MSRFIKALLWGLVLTSATSFCVRPVRSTLRGELWAVLIEGHKDFQVDVPHMYDVLKSCYTSEENIMYLSINTSKPGVDLYANRANVIWALKDWLSQSSYNDTIFIFINTHGGGVLEAWYNLGPAYPTPPFFLLIPGYNVSRLEVGGDEGNELTEADLYWDSNGNGEFDPEDKKGIDVDGDGAISNNTWIGIDEYIELSNGNEVLWDDEVAGCLAGLKYRRLILVSVSCAFVENYTEGYCFSGGFIDDLSGPRRIIISPTNETYYSWAYNESITVGGVTYQRGESFWAHHFINALDLRLTDVLIEADKNGDGYVSIYEAYMYAWSHDPARKEVRSKLPFPSKLDRY